MMTSTRTHAPAHPPNPAERDRARVHALIRQLWVSTAELLVDAWMREVLTVERCAAAPLRKMLNELLVEVLIDEQCLDQRRPDADDDDDRTSPGRRPESGMAFDVRGGMTAVVWPFMRRMRVLSTLGAAESALLYTGILALNERLASVVLVPESV